MAFFKKLFSGGEPVNENISDAEVDALVREYLAKENSCLNFTLINEHFGSTIYAVQLRTAINNKSIPKQYHLIMKGLNVYLVKVRLIDGEWLMRVPESFEIPKNVISPLSFSLHSSGGLTVSFIEYNGYYQED